MTASPTRLLCVDLDGALTQVDLGPSPVARIGSGDLTKSDIIHALEK
ncbi:hypothetical protein EDC35_106141 [Thiobaca trueperi]|uniref:Uncharacterized protein n=1 Tax=Thiobaca trueperi TaxID=127458 RepID=A0A4R3MV61_9GAMM|nr:hypothetical protein EDC35_106141 [Thiobaca trueperi]